MGKSSHRSRKRRSTSPEDRLRNIESKLARLNDVLARGEVRTQGRLSSPTPVCPFPVRGNESNPRSEVSDNRENRDGSLESFPATPASQEGLRDSHSEAVSGYLSDRELQSVAPVDRAVELVDNCQLPPTEDESVNILAKELFGSDPEGTDVATWNEMVIQKWQTITRQGLPTEQRAPLLKKYSPPEAIAFLKAPQLNPECKSGLGSNSIRKRDEYNTKNQDQVGIALYALGEAISDFLRPEIQSSLTPEARGAVAKVHEGAKVLADLFFRLSLARRAQITPAFSLLAKTTANAIPADNFLFGTSFGEELKKASTMEKSSRDMMRTPLSISNRSQQPIKQPIGPTTTGLNEEDRGENQRAPVVTPIEIPLEETLAGCEVLIAGRLSLFLAQWRKITTDREILQAISGYRLPFSHQPPAQTVEPTIQMSQEEIIICKKEIARLCKRGAIEPVSKCKNQFLSPFFLIRKTSGGWRFILNLKRLNEFITVPHFKTEDWRTVVQLLSPGDFLATIDLEDAYLLLPIHREDRHFLRFSFSGQFFQFRVLPFGLASAPYIFTRILKPILHHIRQRGIFSVVFLDDFLLMAPSRSQSEENVSVVLNLLSSLGFIVNKRKSSLSPQRSCRYLGFIFDTDHFSISIPQDKRSKLLHRTLDLLTRSACKIRFLASYIGSLISICPAVQYGLLHTKILEREKFLALAALDGDFEARMTLPASIKEDLRWWGSIFADPTQRNIICPGKFILEIFADASLTGWGAVCKGSRTHGFWSSNDKKNHINYLELLAVFYALRCFASQLRDCEILIRVDNLTALSYINRMGSIRFPHLSKLARKIWCWCADRNLFIYAAYIPSAQNIEADTESRAVSEETEWCLQQSYFDKISSVFGFFDIDLFASSINKKCPCFVSWLPDPLAFAVDAFSLHWGSFYFYAFPSFILILRTLRKIITDKAEGVLVVPWWPAQPWFPLFEQLMRVPSKVENNFPGGREIIRQAFLFRGTPATALDITLASITNSTIAQYTKPLRLWWCFCKEKEINCFSPPIPLVLEFLSKAMSNIGYSSINSYRSAISLVSAEEVGSHPLVRRFLRGVAALKPQRPRYDFVWDPSPVIAHLASLYPYEDLPFDRIPKKLVTLFALTTAQRLQTLTAIQITNITISDSLVIKILARLKTSKIGKSQPLLIFNPFLAKPELCIVRLVKVYLELTQEIRQEGCNALFISLRPPHRAVTSQTLGRWVKDILEEAGIDISVFSAHSTRHASTSFAASKGVNLEEIRQTAGWTETSRVFAQFYNRPIIKDPAFQNAILDMP
ncbi:uncharacterized protein LOC118646722 [Monomorium pharaonis]|uniref:uncharacterized protein LOC118646722 n=1 Tax=Monomorium pharaonis TaxID=307658 RepID=UPI0017478641|nr:uncharacterized protein LOC118646722 [Monomorium pharaonis]